MQRVLSAFILLSTVPAFAQDSLKYRRDTTRHLGEVVVSYQAVASTPVTYRNLSAAVLEEKNTGQEPSFILSETPGITVQSDAGNQQGYSYYRMRGMDQTRVNMTLDGMPMNEPEDQGAYFSNYPDILNSVSSIQIQRGPGTTQNGSASYAGSVQLFSPNLKDTAHSSIGIGYGSWNSARIYGEYQSGLKNGKALYVRASQLYTDGYKYHSSNNAQSVFISGGLYYDKTSWKINMLAGQQRNGLAWLGVVDSLVRKDRRINANSPDEKDHFFQALVQLQNEWRPGPRSVINTSAYYTYLKGNYDFDPANYVSGTPGEDGYMFNYSFLSHFAGMFSNYTLSGQSLKWTTGINGNAYQRRHLGSDNADRELYRNTGYKKEFSAFTKLEYYLGKFTFFGDIQYRLTTFDYTGDLKLKQLKWDFLNPKAGVSYALNNGIDLYYSIARTGREPTRNDFFNGEDNLTVGSNGVGQVYNPWAETVTDQEAGIRWSGAKMVMNLNGYWMAFSNELVLNGETGPNGLPLTDNVLHSFRRGVELYLKYAPDTHWSFTSNAAWNNSRIKEKEAVFTPLMTPSWIINEEVGWKYGGWGTALSGRYQSKSYIDFSNQYTLDSYFLVNARAHYTLRHYEFSLFLNNITNAKYYGSGYREGDHVKYFVQAPVNYYIAVKYSF